MSINDNQLIIIGHKGGAYHQAPDNSLKAFKKAIKFGGDYIEIDVRKTKDNHYVIIHDSDIFKLTGVHELVEETNLSELKTIKLGEDQKIPTLDEVLKLVKTNINLMCELKTRNLAKGLIKTLKKENMLETTIFVSFFTDELKKIQKINPKLSVGAIVPINEEFIPEWSQRKAMIDEVIQMGFSYILTRFKNVNSQFVNYCHKNGLKVIVYAVKTKIIMKKYILWSVDGIIVKNIGKAKEVLNELKEQ